MKIVFNVCGREGIEKELRSFTMSLKFESGLCSSFVFKSCEITRVRNFR